MGIVGWDTTFAELCRTYRARKPIFEACTVAGGSMNLAAKFGLGVGAALAMPLLLVTAANCCRERASDKQSIFYTQMPKDATYIGLRWPAIRDQTPPVYFRIPRENLDVSRLRGRRADVVDWVFVNLRIDQPAGNGGAIESGTRRRVEVELNEIPNNADMRADRFDLWRINCTTCTQDGGFGRLTRYSKMTCVGEFNKQQSHLARQGLRHKAADDPSPAGCWRNRSSAYFTNSIPQDRGEQGVDVECSAGTCRVYLQVAGRMVTTDILLSEAYQADALADAIRSEMYAFVVTKEGNLQNAPLARN